MKSRREILYEFYQTLPGTYRIEWMREPDLPGKNLSPTRFMVVGKKK